MSKDKKPERFTQQYIDWLTKQFPDFVKDGLADGANYSDITGSVIIAMDEQIQEVEMVVKQMEAMITAITSDQETEGRV